MKVTMADVAAAAGVNKATVSRVLRGDARISQATSEKVWAAAKRLHYRPDAVARGLSSRTNDLIGVVFRDLSVPWAGAFLSGMERVLGRLGLDCIVKETGADGGRRSHAVHRLVSRRADGLVFVDDNPQDTAGLSVVSVGSPNPSGAHVSVDLEATAAILKGFAGARKIRYVAGEKPLFTGLGKLLQQEIKTPEGRLLVCDGAKPPWTASLEHPHDEIVICGSRREAVYPGVWVLEYPAFEMGVLAARILVNGLRNRGVRPQAVSLVPSLFSPEGELFQQF